MSSNINSSNKGSPTIGNTHDSNNYSFEKNNSVERCHALSNSKSKVVTITRHLCNPCPGLYSDIFGSVKIICKDPSHGSNDQVDLGGNE